MAGVLVLGGCGGDDSSTDDGSTAVQEETVAPDTETVEVPAGFDIPEGVPLADGLIPELAEIPLPDGPAVFSVGSANDADVDPRETAQQQVHFTISPTDVVDFYVTELPASGFVVDSAPDPADAAGGQQVVIEFTDPDGLPGRIFVSPGAWSESQININLFRSGTA